MPSPKTQRKSSSAPSKNQYTAELSSSQLVLGITILMVFGLACFLLGVLIGKFDPSLQPEQQVAKTTETPAVSTTVEKTGTDAVPSKKPADNETTKPIVKTETPVIEEKKIVVPSTPVAKPVTPSTQIPESASVTISDLQPDAAQAPPPEPPKVVIPENTPQNAAAVPVTVEQPIVQAAAPVEVKQPEVSAPTAPKSTYWAVQVAAFKNDSGAEVERKKLESQIPYKIEIWKKPGDVWSRLIVGHYGTKDEADALKQELKDKYKLAQPHSVSRN